MLEKTKIWHLLDQKRIPEDYTDFSSVTKIVQFMIQFDSLTKWFDPLV